MKGMEKNVTRFASDRSVPEDRRQMRYTISYAVLFLSVILLFFWSIAAGSVDISFRETLDILFTGGDQGFSGSADGNMNRDIIWKIRLPRVIASAVLGGALALSGFLLQTFFRNPIAGPFVLGISSGAKMTVALTMIFLLQRGIQLTSWGMILSAFAGSLLSMSFVLLISGKVGKSSMLIVCGVMTGYICSAITDFAVTFADDADIVNLHNWSLGSFSGISWENTGVICAMTAVVSAAVFLCSKPIGAYQLGESYAHNMGVNVRLFRGVLIFLSSMLSACVTAFAGPVSFVGIAVPHLIRWLFHTSKPVIVIPACFLGGAAFCMLCDLIARTAFAPVEMSVSAVTAVLGAPVVIIVMIRKRREV